MMTCLSLHSKVRSYRCLGRCRSSQTNSYRSRTLASCLQPRASSRALPLISYSAAWSFCSLASKAYRCLVAVSGLNVTTTVRSRPDILRSCARPKGDFPRAPEPKAPGYAPSRRPRTYHARHE